ncbi:MAG: hypothetical protein MUF23_10475, partial [Pirellula sp.]|nr:hypothetical protein [Pirellula sp.]
MSPVDIRPTRSLIPTVLHAFDSVLICLSVPLSSWLIGQTPPENWLSSGLLASIVMFVIGECAGIYRPSRGRSADVEVVLITVSWIASILALTLISRIIPLGFNYSWLAWLAFSLVAAVLLLNCHMCVRGLIETANDRGYMASRTAIVGWNRLGIEIARNSMRAGDCGMKVVGIFDDRGGER